MKTLKLIQVIALGFIISLSACKKDPMGPKQISSDRDNFDGNSLRVSMASTPDDYASLELEVSKVEAQLDRSGWVTLSNQTQYLSVLDFTNGMDALIAHQSSVEAGVYTKLKITFGDEHYLTLNESSQTNGTSINSSNTISLQWIGPKEVEIIIDEQVSENFGAEVLLDFKVSESIEVSLNQYIIHPVLKVIEDASTGLKGMVEDGINASIMLENEFEQFYTYTDANGNFLIRDLDPGDYDLTIIPDAPNSELPQELQNQLVSNGSIKNVGTISF